eukprot:4960029-Amphidinium_carterae.1
MPSPPLVWVELTQNTGIAQHARRLGLLSRVLAEAIYLARSDEAPLRGQLLSAAVVTIAARN